MSFTRTQVLSSLGSIPQLETTALFFYSSGKSLIHRTHRLNDEYDPVDTQLRRLAELNEGGSRVSVGFNGSRTKLGVPQLANLNAFMRKFHCSSHSFTILCECVTVPQD